MVEDTEKGPQAEVLLWHLAGSSLTGVCLSRHVAGAHVARKEVCNTQRLQGEVMCMQLCVHAATYICMCVCVGVNYTTFGFATEGSLEICRCLLMFCNCLVLWGIYFCCCYWSQMYNSLITT